MTKEELRGETYSDLRSVELVDVFELTDEQFEEIVMKRKSAPVRAANSNKGQRKFNYPHYRGFERKCQA